MVLFEIKLIKNEFMQMIFKLLIDFYLSLAGVFIFERQRFGWRLSRVRLHQNPSGRVRRSAQVAVCAHSQLHAVRPVGQSGQGVQHRREFHSGPDVGELPAAVARTRCAGLRFPAFRLARNAQEATVCQRRPLLPQSARRSG